MTARPANHLVVAVCPFLGHARPLASIACNLILSQPQLNITLLTSLDSEALVKQVIGEQFGGEASPRLQLVCAVPPFKNGNVFDKAEAVRQRDDRSQGSLHEVVVALLKGEQDIVTQTGRATGLCGIKPSGVISDWMIFFFRDRLDSVKTTAGFVEDLPYYIFFPSSIAGVTFQHCPEVGGCAFMNMRHEANRVLRADETLSDEDIVLSSSFEELAASMWKHSSGKLMPGGGGPQAYDYEFMPQLDAIPLHSDAYGLMELACTDLVKRCDGVVVPWTSPLLEPDARAEAHRLLPHLDWFTVGSQGPESLWDRATISRAGRSDVDARTLAFLDQMHAEVGPKRTLLISFGSIFYPVFKPEHISILLETLLDMRIPFLFAKASPMAGPVDDALIARIGQSGRALVVPFVPQYEVLTHPATGWFLSHGGSNSTSEALICGVPTILWPFIADQPGIAAQFSVKLELSFELLQVRSGPSLGKPTARGPVVQGTNEAIEAEMRDVFGKLEGSEGLKIRRNVEQMSAAMRRERAKGGSAWKEMQRLGRIGLTP